MIYVRKLMLTRQITLVRAPLFQFCQQYNNNKSSKDVESDMKFQRWQNLQKQKSFVTLNPKKPTIKDSYEKPKFISYSMDTLREYSTKYPQYLLTELQNPKSQFIQLINKKMLQLWLQDKKEVIELVLFLDGWGFQPTPIVQRWAQNQTFTLGEMFELLKTKYKLAPIFQNMLIEKLKDDLPLDQYPTLFKLLNFYRLKGLGSGSFYQAMQQHFIDNIKSLSASNTTVLLIHYTNNTNETIESRLRIMKAVEERIYAISKFLNADELISVLYCYLKLGTATDTLLQQLQERILLNIQIFKPEQLVKLLTLCCSLPRRIPIVLQSFSNYLFKDKLHYSILPTLYKIAAEHSLATDQFLKKIEPLLIQNIHNLTPEQVADCCWGFAVMDPIEKKKASRVLGGEQIPNSELFYRKVEEIIQGGLRNYQVQQVTKIIWAMLVKNYSPTGQFWKQLQSWLLQQLSRKQSTIKQASLVMWAYTNQRPLLGATINKITQLVFANGKNMDEFDLATTCWFYSTLLGLNEIKKEIAKVTYQRFLEIFDEMNMLEILKCLRWLVQMVPEIEEGVRVKFIGRVEKDYLTYTYPVLINILAILPKLVPEKEKPRYQKLLVKIYYRIQELKRVKPVTQESESKSDHLQAEIQDQVRVRKQRQAKKEAIAKEEDTQDKQQEAKDQDNKKGPKAQ